MKLLGLGLDLVELDNFTRRLTPELIGELFTPAERNYCESKAKPAEHYAARFAAKEAVMKALGAGLAQGLRFDQIEVGRDEGGAVHIKLDGKAAARAAELGVGAWRVSLTHTRSTAAAVAAALAL
ncbi:MAG: holo-[acyl-carrier-protein] synthase [Candidatus Coatesbacteria bacterium]|nr:holo-[acyl-carrier-protein] synthase [Candidatus Coatesbacteria bacterium]